MKKTALLVLSAIILCAVCVSQAEGKELPVFASIQEVIDSTDCHLEIHDHSDHIVLILEKDGRYIRMVTLLDDQAKDLYKNIEAEDHSITAIKAFEKYAWALPLSYTEDLPDVPKRQTELDELKGKTIRELMDEGFGKEIIINKDEIAFPVHIYLEYGSYKYEFEVTDAASGDPQIMTVKSGKFDGLSRTAFDSDNQEDYGNLQ